MVRPPVEENICLRCKGARLLCGKKQCPILMKHSILKSTIPPEILKIKRGQPLFGASPPAIFVGHVGYPIVNIGPLLPLGEFSKEKDTSFLDAPESWFGKSLDDIISYRSGMIRSNFKMGVKYQENIEQLYDRLPLEHRHLLDATQELTLAVKSVDTETKLSHVRLRMQYDNHSQPQGPIAHAEEIKVIDNVKVPKAIDKVVYDTDLNAVEAITGYLYKSEEVNLTNMQRLFAAGLLGIKKNRKLVPTRWTITAIDDIIGKTIKPILQHLPTIDKYYTFAGSYLDNTFMILFVPGPWSFEMNECWEPSSIWNTYIPQIHGAQKKKMSNTQQVNRNSIEKENNRPYNIKIKKNNYKQNQTKTQQYQNQNHNQDQNQNQKQPQQYHNYNHNHNQKQRYQKTTPNFQTASQKLKTASLFSKQIGLSPQIMTDYEYEQGRKKYASNVTGAYYAARKEIEEFLARYRRQARAIVFREVAGGYVVPLGVWVIRETIKNILSLGWKAPHVEMHETLTDALNRLNRVFKIPAKYWVHNSKLIPYIRGQTRIDQWLH